MACKRFDPKRRSTPSDTEREVKNLQVLKESITSNHHIGLHLAILLYKGEHLILLPWADHYDLNIFLREGYNSTGGQVYVFSKHFPRYQDGDALKDMSTQMLCIANALQWLHDGVRVIGEERYRKVRLAHMDLKPDNILIVKPENPMSSCVGRWVITDFGISAFKENDDLEASDVSVRDYYRDLTLNTTPLRQPGTYQPPEVETEAKYPHQAEAVAKNGMAGRRGDIWSFGCIFSEVFAFALGRKTAVEDFREGRLGRVRRETHLNDCFYESIPQEVLNPLGHNEVFQRRPSIDKCLRKLSQRYFYPNNTLKCCAESILKLLVVDGESRPDAKKLVKKMEHVVRHITTARTEDARKPGYFNNCPLDRHNVDTSLIPSRSKATPSQPLQQTSPPTITYTDTTNEIHEMRNYESSILPKENGTTVTNLPAREKHANPPASTELFGPNTPDRLRPQSVPELNIDIQAKRGPFGITIDQDRDRVVGQPLEHQLNGLPNHILSVALCQSSTSVAYLTKVKRSQYAIYFYRISFAGGRATIPAAPTIRPLPVKVAWSRIVVANDHVVVWGDSHQDEVKTVGTCIW